MIACQHCGEPIYPGEKAAQNDMHVVCLLRLITGGLNHLRQSCSCYGGAEPPDPPEMTRREAAEAAVAFMRERGQL